MPLVQGPRGFLKQVVRLQIPNLFMSVTVTSLHTVGEPSIHRVRYVNNVKTYFRLQDKNGKWQENKDGAWVALDESGNLEVCHSGCTQVES